MEKLACLLSSPSGLVVTLRYGRLQLAPYAKVWHTVAVLFRPWRRNGSGGCLPTPLSDMACLLSSWPSSWRSVFSRRRRDVTVRGKLLVPSRVACSRGQDLVSSTSWGRIGGIGSDQSEGADSPSWSPRRGGCDHTPVHHAGRDLGGALQRRVT